MKRSAQSRIMILLLSTVFVLGCFAAGCSLNTSGMSDADAAAEGYYRIYYVNSEGTALIRKNYKALSTDFEGILEELLNTFMTTDSTQFRSALPEGVPGALQQSG